MIFQLQLTGYVGSSTFSAKTVKSVLAANNGKHVDVLIDSFGGSLPEGLSISAAFRDHGDVTVHFRGMNASAATIASMGAKKISMAPEAMYLVHKVSMTFFDWASRNADQLDDFIKALQSDKEDLDAMDRNVAALYAARCRKPASELLDLMEKESWISAQEALEWGFIDEIQEYDASDSDRKKVKISNAQAFAFRSLGLPLPPVEIESESKTFINQIVDAIKNLFNPSKMDTIENTAQTDGNSQQSQESSQQSQESSQQSTENPLQAEVDRLTAELNAIKQRTPAASTQQVMSPAPRNNGNQESHDDEFSRYCRTSASARKLFDSIP